MLPYFSEAFANPASRHTAGQEVNKVVEAARETVAEFVAPRVKKYTLLVVVLRVIT